MSKFWTTADGRLDFSGNWEGSNTIVLYCEVIFLCYLSEDNLNENQQMTSVAINLIQVS